MGNWQVWYNPINNRIFNVLTVDTGVYYYEIVAGEFLMAERKPDNKILVYIGEL